MNKILIWLFTPFIRFVYWVRKRIAYEFLKLSLVASNVVDVLLRLEDPTANNCGFEKHKDLHFKTLALLTIKSDLLDRNTLENPLINKETKYDIYKYSTYYNNNKITIDEIIKNAEKDETIRKWMAIALLSKSEFWARTGNLEQHEQCFAEAKRLAPNAKTPKFGNLWSYKRQAMKEGTKASRILSERAMPKIRIDYKALPPMLAILSFLSFVGSLAHTKSILIFYGVDSDIFFNISDYVSASIDQISVIFIATAISAISFWMAHRRHLTIPTQFGNAKLNKIEDYFWKFGLVMFIFLGIIIGGLQTHTSIYIILILLSYIFSYYICSNFLDFDLKSYFLVSITIIYATNIYYGVAMHINKIEEAAEGDFCQNTIKYIQIYDEPVCPLHLITSSSQYFIILNKKDKMVTAIHRDGTHKVDMNDKSADHKYLEAFRQGIINTIKNEIGE